MARGRYSPRRLLQPLRRRLDRHEGAPCERPGAALEGVRYPEFRWDLGTLIAVFPPEAPFHLLALNWVLGATGTSFDQVRSRSRAAARDTFDLQLCLEGRGRSTTYKAVHSVAREAAFTPGAVGLRLGERLSVEGGWPDYQIRYRQPGERLDLDLHYRAWPGIHWWARAPRMYNHYSNFGLCRVAWRWGDQEGTLSTPALLEHGWGNHLLPLRIPLGLFRYEVLHLPGGGIGISLLVDAPGGLELASAAVHRPGPSAPKAAGRYGYEVLEWESLRNRNGQPRRLPKRWTGRQAFAGGPLIYEAERSTPPRPIIGDGFLHGFAWRAEGAMLPGGRAEGSGYVEQMGRP